MKLTLEDGRSVEVPQYGVRPMPPLNISMASPGGGGWGDPGARDPARVLSDVEDGVVSPQAARDVYAVALSADGRTIDIAATSSLRQSKKAVPGT
jgi:N-methylhydantoinase B